MRILDRKIGVPLCFILTCVHSIKKIFKKPCKTKKPDKILFLKLSEMGSMVLAYPLFKKTIKMLPEARLYFLTFTENRYAVDILNILPKNNVFTIDSDNFHRFLSSSLRTIWKLRKEKITLAIDMELFARSTALLSFLIGARYKVGYFRFHNEGLYRGDLLTHKVAFNPHIHMAYNLLNLIYAFDSHSIEIPLNKKSIDNKDIIIPKLTISEESRKKIIKKLENENRDLFDAKKIILLNPNSSDIIPLRKWPSDNYIQLARLLLKHDGVFVILTGTSSEKKEADFICRSIKSKKCINLAGKTSFSELIDLYNVSDILITNDSGPVHFSTMTNIKTFAFFGPETPALYGPLGKNCHVFYAHYGCSPCVSAFNQRKSACNNNKCLKAISVQEVYEKLKKELNS